MICPYCKGRLKSTGMRLLNGDIVCKCACCGKYSTRLYKGGKIRKKYKRWITSSENT